MRIARPACIPSAGEGQGDFRGIHGVPERRGPKPPAETVRLALQIAGALEAAHRSGMVRRDLKPGNVLTVGRATGEAGSTSYLATATAPAPVIRFVW